MAEYLEEPDEIEILIMGTLLTREIVGGVCDTPGMCFEYTDFVRCGPCSLKCAAMTIWLR